MTGTPVVAHVNYHFFHSTQSFIYFYLAGCRRTKPICLTRTPESPAIGGVPSELAADFYLYRGPGGNGRVGSAAWSAAHAVRHRLSRLPAGVAQPMLDVVDRSIVPRLRRDADAGHYTAWAEEILRTRGAELIHAYFGPIGWRMLELRRELGLPLVVTFLGDDVAPSLGPWWSWWMSAGGEAPDWPSRLRELVGEADLLLVEGPFLRQRLIELGCDPGKVAVQRFAIPLRNLAPVEPERPRGAKTVIVFAGRFCAQKGLLYSLEALREIWGERQDVEFRVVGDDRLADGGYAAQVYGYVRRHGLEQCVRFLGFLNHRECLEQIRDADIFLHPSIVDDEGLSEGGAPTTIIEAQALGIPVVATWHCDIPNVTLPGESALLVPERDGRALAEALRELLDDPARRNAMGQAGRRHVEELHDIDREAPALEDRYLRLLGSARN
jgi:colanic acid/amylovoran biosynthesis glycosyltransferase